VILPPDLLALYKTAFFEFSDDPLDGPFGDSDPGCHLSQNDRWILREKNEDVGVIGQKRPASFFSAG
jgi:hypothetical protein